MESDNEQKEPIHKMPGEDIDNKKDHEEHSDIAGRRNDQQRWRRG